MIYGHMVKYKGTYYQAGEDVPIGDEKPKKDDSGSAAGYSGNMLDSGREYTKADINKMDKSELQDLAFEKGVEDAYSMTGSGLKKILIDMLVG